MSRRTLSLLLAALTWPLAASAQPPVTGPIQLPKSSETKEELEEARFLTVSLAVFGTAGTYGMHDLNNNIDRLTIVARDQWGAPLIKLDRITSGIGGGVGLHAFFRNKVFLAAEYERLTGKSNVGGRLDRSNIQVPATAYLGTLGYAIYAKAVRFGFAVGGGYYLADGTAEFTVDQEVVEKYTMGGNVFGQHYVSFVDTPLLGRFRITGMVGYRHARVDNPDVNLVLFVPETQPAPGEPEPPPRFPIEGQGSSLDWSGLMARVALDFTLF